MLCLSRMLQEFVISVVLRGILVRSQSHTLVRMRSDHKTVDILPVTDEWKRSEKPCEV